MNDSAHPSSPERVSLDQVLRIAELAQLELTAEEQREMLRDLNSILGHVAQLNELNTADVPAMAQVSELLAKPTPAAGNAGSTRLGLAQGRLMEDAEPGNDALRDDVLRPSLDRTEVMAQAPETDSAYFKVPKVIER